MSIDQKSALNYISFPNEDLFLSNVPNLHNCHGWPFLANQSFLGKMERNDPVDIILMQLYTVPTSS